jgi:uncharacterized protein with HEPN domain
MAEKTILTRLHDMRDAINGISETLAGIKFDTYKDVWSMRRATERGIEIISEASRHIPPEMKAKFPEIPWQEIASIGNLLRHEYAKVDDRIIWNVTQRHLIELGKAVEAMLREFAGGSERFS